ncbi:ABC transporter ATP-binding protein [Pseudomonadales bacterium]|jgi:lipoprotein-releasing system ATP-binding protein|nr:ABC transporter ATP-binding protein [Pseudomonadales bacterium]MDC1299516.1 ABC transporter ATP-binding protein [Pseudomonadales bacterium]
MNNPTDSSFSLVANNVSKQYEVRNGARVNVLDNLNLTIECGEHIAITGASGSGKSTLLHILAGLERPSAGQVYVLGQNIDLLDHRSIANFRNQRLGFIYQHHHLIPELSAIENVALPAQIKGQTRKASFERADALLNEVLLSERKTHFPWQLSGGESQRCAIARALMNSPDVIFADEPTGNLDQNAADQVSELMMSSCRAQQATLIIVTHNLKLAERTDRKLTLSNGAIT